MLACSVVALVISRGCIKLFIEKTEAAWPESCITASMLL